MGGRLDPRATQLEWCLERQVDPSCFE